MSEKNTQDVEVGRRVQIFRKRAELTQAQLSTYASQYGDPITQQTIAKIEAGARGLKFAEGIAIAKALRVPAEAFISSDIATERFLRQVMTSGISDIEKMTDPRRGLGEIALAIHDCLEARENYLAFKAKTQPEVSPAITEETDRKLAPLYAQLEEHASRLAVYLRSELKRLSIQYPDLVPDLHDPKALAARQGEFEKDPQAAVDTLYSKYVHERQERRDRLRLADRNRAASQELAELEKSLAADKNPDTQEQA